MKATWALVLLLSVAKGALPAQYAVLPPAPEAFSIREYAEARDSALREGDVFIPRAYRVRNSHGACVWCAAETMCWGAAGLESFKGIKQTAVDNGWRGAGMGNLMGALKEAGIPFESTTNRDYDLLERAVKFGTGAYFEIEGHALVLVGFDAESVRVIDNNGAGEVQSWSRSTFNRRWNGCALFPKLFKRPRQPSPEDHPPVKPEPIIPKPDKGEKGDPGPRGPAGPPGPPGKDADLARIAALEEEIKKLKAYQYEAVLYDVSGREVERVKFGVGKPLNIFLVPVPVAGPKK